MKTILRTAATVCTLIIFATTSCKNIDRPENDGAGNAPGSFNENHRQEVDTVKTDKDSSTSNSTQTDPTAF